MLRLSGQEMCRVLTEEFADTFDLCVNSHRFHAHILYTQFAYLYVTKTTKTDRKSDTIFLGNREPTLFTNKKPNSCEM